MSTRATYQFTGARSRGLNHSFPTITVYIHHDGYPEGAAHYFWNAHHSARGSLPVERFLFANDRAEITESHEAHGDTEYRYTVRQDDTGDYLTAYAGKWPGGDGPREWSVFFVGTVVEFINKYGEDPQSCIDEFTPILRVPVGGQFSTRFEYLSRTAILSRAAAALKAHDDYKARFPQYTGNIAGQAAVCAGWSLTLKEYDKAFAPALAALAASLN